MMTKIFFIFIFIFIFSFVSFSQEISDGDSVNTENQVNNNLITNEENQYSDLFEEDEILDKKNEALSNNRIEQPKRLFELGFLMNTNFSNNYFNANEMLVENLVIDLKKMADEMPEKGFNLNANFISNFYMNLNLNNGIHIGSSFGVESYGYLNVSKELFDFLGKGNSMNEKLSFDADLRSDAFFYMDLAVGFDLLGFHLELIPSVFLPLIHATTDNVNGYFENDKNGKISAMASADVLIYSFTDMKPIFDNNFDINKIMDSIKEGWGFDLSSTLEHKIFDSLNGCVYSRIPIVPGQLNYSTKMTIKASFDVDKVSDIINKKFNNDFKISDKVYGRETFNLNRPLRVGTKVSWQPFGKWCTFGGLLGFGIKSPFMADAYGYAEYDLSVGLDFFVKKWNLLGINLSSSYLNEVFCHSVGLMLNFHVVEIDAGVSAVGGSFESSFKGAGLGAYILLAFGW